jgi:hypothetical protein
MRSIVVAVGALVLATCDASAFSRCRLSADECRIVLGERYRLASIAEYESRIPSRRTRYQQEMHLIDRAEARFNEAASKQPKRIAAEMIRLLVCDTIEDADIRGYPTRLKGDCR